MEASDADTMKWCLMGALFLVSFIMGLLPIWLLPLIRKWSEKAALLLSSISCFSGGILLGVCFVDMIPEAMEDFDDWQKLSGTDATDFAWILFGTVCGFLIVYIIDGLATTCVQRSEKSAEAMKNQIAASMSVERLHRATICSMDAEHALKIKVVPRTSRQDYITTLTLVLAMCIHVLIEGFALGVQPTSESFLALFVGIAIHKVLVVFAIGMKLYEKHPTNKKFVAASMSLLASLTFVGGAVGILLQDANIDEVAKTLTTAILSCFSSGTFLYITFFEVLSEETGHIIERLCCVLGFALMSLALMFL